MTTEKPESIHLADPDGGWGLVDVVQRWSQESLFMNLFHTDKNCHNYLGLINMF